MATDFTLFDRQCMARALELARKGWFSAHPNPRVGCVIAAGSDVVGEGYHLKAGEPHAEVNALTNASDKARGATAYVTLEPCNHQGRTGPCARALIDAGIAEVVYGMADPHQHAAGGIATLLSAGIRVRGPLMASEAAALNPGFVTRCQSGLPRVTLKLAMSVDGRTAMASGESQWITGAAARADVQKLRAQSGAILTGTGTVLADNPAMTVRAAQLPEDIANRETVLSRQPLRVIVDSQLKTPADASIVAEPGQVIIATATTTTRQYPVNVEVLAMAGANGKVNLKALLRELARRECNDVLVEAGAGLAGALVAAGLVDVLVLYVAPKLMGNLAKPLLTLPFDNMSQAVDLHIADVRAVGNDWRVTATFTSAEKT